MCNYLNIICKFAFKLSYLKIFLETICFEFPCVTSSNPQTPHPIWKEICPSKSSISILTLSISSSVDFYHLTRDFNWNPELLLWKAGFVFSHVSFCRYLLFRRCVCDFCEIWFSYPSLVDFIIHFFVTVIPAFRSSFPNSGHSMFPILILCWNFVSGLTVFGICFEACWLFVVSFCGVFRQEFPRWVEIAWYKIVWGRLCVFLSHFECSALSLWLITVAVITSVNGAKQTLFFDFTILCWSFFLPIAAFVIWNPWIAPALPFQVL